MVDTIKRSIFYSDEINLYDVWQKLLNHKKIFWIVFCLVFMVSSMVVLFHQKKYRVTQIIEFGRSPDCSDENNFNINKAKFIIRKNIVPKAKRDYCNSSKDEKTCFNNEVTVSLKSEVNVLFVSADVPLIDIEKCNFIFGRIKDFLIDDAKRISNRLNEIYVLKKSLEKKFVDFSRKSVVAGVDGKFSGSEMSNLAEEIDILQTKINRAIFPKALEVVISKQPVGPSQLLLFILNFFIALFITIFVVFMVEVVSCYKYRSKK